MEIGKKVKTFLTEEVSSKYSTGEQSKCWRYNLCKLFDPNPTDD